MAGELGVGRKAPSAGDLGDQLGGREHSAAGQLEQLWRLRSHARVEFLLEQALLAPKRRAAAHEIARQAHPHRLLATPKPCPKRAQHVLMAQRAHRRGELRVDVVQVPAQPVLDPCRLRDQILAVVEQQLDFERALVEERRGQRLDSLPKRCPSDRHGVDRVGLAPLASRPARTRHQLRRHPHDALAAVDQEPLEPARDMAAVLDRPDALWVERPGPVEQLGVAICACRDRLAATQLRLTAP